jgi:pimeloyl-ACP methyl ester carboxylesterase
MLLSFSSFVYASSLTLNHGSRSFVVEGGEGRENLKLSVHYHLPKSFSPDSPILMVLPGSERTAKKYRHHWIQASEKYSVLVLSISYSTKKYPHSANYNLARMVKERDGHFVVNKKTTDWIFSDLDRIFDLVVAKTGSLNTNYDLFGHSAGGQLGHRFALFSPESKANRIISANSGWYTTPIFDVPFPYGLADGPFERREMQMILKKSFVKQLVVLLGEKDDRHKIEGNLRRGSEVDEQGLSRIERGEYFYFKAKQYAQENDFIFNWDIHVVKGVGHSSAQMSAAAAKYLYSNR